MCLRALLDEVFGESNFVVLINFQKTGGIEGAYLSNTVDFVLWFAKNRDSGKFRRLLVASARQSIERETHQSAILPLVEFFPIKKIDSRQEAGFSLFSVKDEKGKPKRGRIAVKVINHLGDEVMKVFRV